MADWFKIYETDLDESRLRYAMSKLPEVWPVWTGVLVECCKHRSDVISWGGQEQELFGFSDRLKISIPKVNAAIGLLVEIRYIEIIDNHIRVLKWGEKQDDYLARKSQGYWEKRREKKNLTVIHSDSHIEERRGDEKRVEEIEKREDMSATPPAPPKPLRFQKPTLEAVKLECAKIGLPEDEAEAFLNYYEANGWRVGRNPMKSWPHALINWRKGWQERLQRQPQSFRKTYQQATTADDLLRKML